MLNAIERYVTLQGFNSDLLMTELYGSCGGCKVAAKAAVLELVAAYSPQASPAQATTITPQPW